jgi:hypothetical protein
LDWFLSVFIGGSFLFKNLKTDPEPGLIFLPLEGRANRPVIDSKMTFQPPIKADEHRSRRGQPI